MLYSCTLYFAEIINCKII